MLFNLGAMYFYYKAFEAMKGEQPRFRHQKCGREDDDQLHKQSLSSGSSAREEKTGAVQAKIDLFMNSENQDRVAVSKEILETTRKAETHFRYPAICLVKLEHAIEAVETLMPNDPRQQEVRENLLLSLATIKGNHDHQWPTAFTFLNQKSSEGTVYAALLVLKNSSSGYFEDAEKVKSVLECAQRSERCMNAVVPVLNAFPKNVFLERHEEILPIAMHSVERGDSISRNNLIEKFLDINLSHLLIPAMVNHLEAGFAKARETGQPGLHLSQLDSLMYCAPRHLLTSNTSAIEAAQALPRLELLRDDAQSVAKAAHPAWEREWFVDNLAYLCATIRLKHDFSSIQDWTERLIPNLREPVYLSGEACFETLLQETGSDILAAFEAHHDSAQARDALPALEKVLKGALYRSVSMPRNTALAGAVERLDKLCELISTTHATERTMRITEALEATNTPWLLEHADTIASLKDRTPLPYRKELDSAVITRATEVIHDIAGKAPQVLREYLSQQSQHEYSNAGSSPLNFALHWADRVAINWGGIEGVKQRCISTIDQKECSAGVIDLFTLHQLATRAQES